MIIGKVYDWDRESRETAQDIGFDRVERGPFWWGQLLILRGKRGRVTRYTATHGVGIITEEKHFFPSDHGGAWGARKAALNWIKAQHEGSAE